MKNVYNTSKTNCRKRYMDNNIKKTNRKCNKKKIHENAEIETKEGVYGKPYKKENVYK